MLFSVVVPVYNGESFLEKTIQSVLDQTHTNWELILIDDGSKDGSYSLMERYGAQDARIQCLTQENRGVSYTRNRGIDLATGDYILFVDADDEIAPNTLETIYGALKETPADVVSFNAFRMDVKSKATGVFTMPLAEKSLYLQTEQEKREYIYNALASNKPFGLTWNFAARRELLSDIRFSEDMVLCEDLIFDIQMYQKAKAVVCLPDYLYYYRDNPSGCVNTFNFRKLADLKTAYEAKTELIRRYDLEENRAIVLGFYVDSIINFYYSVLENRPLAEKYRLTVLQDPYICERVQEYKTLGLPQKHALDLLFGSDAKRFSLRAKILTKRKLRKCVMFLKNKE